MSDYEFNKRALAQIRDELTAWDNYMPESTIELRKFQEKVVALIEKADKAIDRAAYNSGAYAVYDVLSRMSLWAEEEYDENDQAKLSGRFTISIHGYDFITRPFEMPGDAGEPVDLNWDSPNIKHHGY